MEITTLQREIMDGQRIAERSSMVLDLNNQLVAAQQENATLNARVAELENQLKSLTPETHDGTV